MTPKRTQEELVSLVLNEIKDSSRTPSDIANEIGSNTATVKRILELIVMIQGKPKIVYEQGETISLVKFEVTQK